MPIFVLHRAIVAQLELYFSSKQVEYKELSSSSLLTLDTAGVRKLNNFTGSIADALSQGGLQNSKKETILFCS